MTEILLIRHGETAWNAARRLQGYLDIPLNAEGERQAQALGRALRDQLPDAIFASDLQRAHRTAQAIADACGMTVQIDPALRERCYGGFEGMLYAEIGERFPDAHAAWQARELDTRFPPGAHVAETLREFSQRAVAVVTRLAAGNYRRLVLVTHGGVLEAVYRHVKGIGYEQARDFEIRNASVNRFAWDGAALRLLQWGDTAHLRDAELAAIDEIDR